MAEGKLIFNLHQELFGAGNVVFAWQQQETLFAVAGPNRVLHVFDRQGKKKAEMLAEDHVPIEALAWDSDGESLAVLQVGAESTSVWNVHARNFTYIEAGSNDRVSFISWAHTLPILAVGTEKGSLVFYSKASSRKIPTVGKHSRRVTTGEWSPSGLLMTGSDDRSLTVSAANGDTKAQFPSIKAEPRMLQWSPSGQVASISLNLRSLLLVEVDQGNIKGEVNFKASYSNLVGYAWISDSTIIAGFSNGWVAVVDASTSEETFSSRVFNTSLDAICICTALQKVSVAGEGTIRVLTFTLKEVRGDKINVPNGAQINKMHWTKDGQVLTVSTVSSNIMAFLMVVPTISAISGNLAAVLSSLTEVSIFECASYARPLATVRLENEPTLLALSSSHIAASQGPHLWLYAWSETDSKTSATVTSKRDCRGNITQLGLNSNWVAYLIDSRVMLQSITGDEQRSFPEDPSAASIAAFAITGQFLFMSDSSPKLRVYLIDERTFVSEYKLQAPVSQMVANYNGTRVALRDTSGRGALYFPASDTVLEIPNFSMRFSSIIWDLRDHNVFAACEADRIVTYIVSPVTLTGGKVEPTAELLSVEDITAEPKENFTGIEAGLKPMLLNNGLLFFQVESEANLRGNFLASHSQVTQWRGRSDTSENHYRYFLQNLALKRFSACTLAAELLDSSVVSEALGQQALHHIDLETAERAFQLAKNVGMVYAIRSVKSESEKLVLLGHVAMMLHKHDHAQEFFLQSSKPQLALDMRKDLQDWLLALKLARNFAQTEEPLLSKQLAQQLETHGNFAEALRLFERAAGTLESQNLPADELRGHMTQCYAGMARTCIRSGDITRGYKIAGELNDLALKVDCAQVCEQMKHFTEAAELYKRASQPEKAASLYIQLKKWKEAAQLMNLISTPKLLIQLAKAKETEGQFKDAEEAYERAGDFESVIRLNLQKLDNPDKAKLVAQTKCPTSTAANLLADFYEQKGDRRQAIEFLVLAGKREDAFVIAQSYDLMEVYAAAILVREEKNVEEHVRIAQYFEGRNKFKDAAKHYAKINQEPKAVRLYLKSGEDGYMDAIRLVGGLKNEGLRQQLYFFFIGEDDGIPKDAKYLYELDKAFGLITDAANTALIVASEELESGNYAAAHSHLFETVKDMRGLGIRVPTAMFNKLMIVHSYNIVKKLVKMQDHLTASRMLIRVCLNISSFPAHSVPILTSTVMECTRAGLKQAAYHWACVLVRPEYRSSLDEKFKKNIEKVAIRKPKTDDLEEETTPCPFCSTHINASDLECRQCKHVLPFCIASGYHMTIEDWSSCPHCGMPGNHTAMLNALGFEPSCPMCEQPLRPTELRVGNYNEELQNFVSSVAE
jgi:WD repeat-containing protein 19